MELTIALAISILSIVITVINFVLSRKDKAIKDTRDADKENANTTSDQKLIDYRLTQVENKLDKILDILDNYDKEIDERASKLIEQHVLLYHQK
jgi:peptidoglycan hydrolase CwlO-like protein